MRECFRSGPSQTTRFLWMFHGRENKERNEFFVSFTVDWLVLVEPKTMWTLSLSQSLSLQQESRVSDLLRTFTFSLARWNVLLNPDMNSLEIKEKEMRGEWNSGNGLHSTHWWSLESWAQARPGFFGTRDWFYHSIRAKGSVLVWLGRDGMRKWTHKPSIIKSEKTGEIRFELLLELFLPFLWWEKNPDMNCLEMKENGTRKERHRGNGLVGRN